MKVTASLRFPCVQRDSIQISFDSFVVFFFFEPSIRGGALSGFDLPLGCTRAGGLTCSIGSAVLLVFCFSFESRL